MAGKTEVECCNPCAAPLQTSGTKVTVMLQHSYGLTADTKDAEKHKI